MAKKNGAVENSSSIVRLFISTYTPAMQKRTDERWREISTNHTASQGAAGEYVLPREKETHAFGKYTERQISFSFLILSLFLTVSLKNFPRLWKARFIANNIQLQDL